MDAYMTILSLKWQALHNGRTFFIFITGLDYKKRSFEVWSLNHSGIFLILCSTFLQGKEHRIRIKKSQNELRIGLQHFIFNPLLHPPGRQGAQDQNQKIPKWFEDRASKLCFFKFLVSNENGRCLVKDSFIVPYMWYYFFIQFHIDSYLYNTLMKKKYRCMKKFI